MTTEATVVFVVVVGLRFLVPLFIPRFPLPACSRASCSTASTRRSSRPSGSTRPATRTTTRRWTCSTSSIAFLSSLQNWTQLGAVSISRFLFFYRMVGVMAFEITGVRGPCCSSSRTPSSTSSSPTRSSGCAGTPAGSAALLAAHRGGHLDLRQAAAGVLDPRRPARLHRHVAGRAVVRPARHRRGRSSGLAVLWFVVRPAPPADPTGRGAWPPTRCPEEMDTAAERDAWTAANVRVWSWWTAGEGRAHRPAVDDLRAHPAGPRGVGPADVRRHRRLRRRQRRHLHRRRSAGRSPRGPRRRLRGAGRRQRRAGAAGPPRPRRATPSSESATLFFVLLLSLLVTMHDRFAPGGAVAPSRRTTAPDPGACSGVPAESARRAEQLGVGQLAQHLGRPPVEPPPPERPRRGRAGRARRPCRRAA